MANRVAEIERRLGAIGGPVSPVIESPTDLEARVKRLENELRMVKARMAKKQEQGPRNESG